jgi:hypothetical protein
MLARCDFRNRWRSALAIAVLVGAIGTIVLATAAGARRSAAALNRFTAYSHTSNLEVDAGNATPAQLATFGRVPGVSEYAVLDAFAVNVDGFPNLSIAASVDGRLGTVVDRPRLVKGRLADPNRADELVTGEGFASAAHLHVGSLLHAISLTPAQLSLEEIGKDFGRPRGPAVQWRIVGIVRRPLDLGDRAANGGVVVPGPGFVRAYQGKMALWTVVLRVRTQHGASDIPGVSAAAQRIFGKSMAFRTIDLTTETHGASDAINVLTIALLIFGAVGALAGAITIGIVLSRDLAHGVADQTTLRALGVTRRQRMAAIVPRAAFIAALGIGLSIAGAIAASPLFPIGIARRADIDVGVHADWMVFLVGVLGIIVLTGAVTTVVAFRATHIATAGEYARGRHVTPAVVETAARIGLRPTVTNGLRMALQPGRGRRAVPVRSAFLGATLGVLGVVGVVVFASSVEHLAATPRLYGWTWNLTAADESPQQPTCDTTDFGLGHIAGVSDIASLCYEQATIDGRPVITWGFTPIRGRIEPEIARGRAPATSDEIALGAVTLKALHERIGDAVTVQVVGRPPAAFQIVGQGVLPRINDADLEPIADAAAVTGGGFARILDPNETSRFLIGRFTPGVDRAEVERKINAISDLRPPASNAVLDGNVGVGTPTPPPEVTRVRQLNWFPPTLALLLAVLAFIAVTHALVVSVQRRRHDLAILMALGFRRRDVRATIGWLATTLALVGLVVGLPAGIIAGRATWRLVAGALGVSAAAPLPSLWIACTIPAALGIVLAIAYAPARAAARTRPAVALQTE